MQNLEKSMFKNFSEASRGTVAVQEKKGGGAGASDEWRMSDGI